MPINSKTESDDSQSPELVNLKAAEDGELENIKCHLDLVLLALEAIANISSEEIIQAAQDLQLESVSGDLSTLWQFSSNPKNDSRARKKLEAEEIRSRGLIICYLANQHQELLRRGVNLLEQVTEQNELPHQTTLLGDYLDKFINYYQARIANSQNISLESLSHLAWKLLTALLFYSGQNGSRLFWSAIFDAAQNNSD
jgi:hypothetical protein